MGLWIIFKTEPSILFAFISLDYCCRHHAL